MKNPLYVKHVSSNVKTGVDTDLGQRTLIVGPNGSGKSAVINSLELALGGFASDIVGRPEMAREIDLMQLAHNGANKLHSMALLSDDSVAKYEAGGEKKKARHTLPKNVDPTFVFPLRAVREALLGSAATTRKFFLSYASSGLTDAEIESGLTGEFRKLYRDILPMVPPGGLPSERLLAVLEVARKRGNDEARAAKATKAAVSTVSRDLPPEPTEGDLAAAKARVASAQKAVDDAVREEMRYQRTMDERAMAERRLVAAGEKLTLIEAREAALVQRLAETQAVAEAAQDSIPTFPMQAALDVLDHQPVGDPCLLCGGETTVESVLDAQEILKNAMADAVNAQTAISVHQAQVARCEAYMRELEAATKEHEAARSAYARFEGMTHSELPDQEALREARDDAQNRYNELLQAKAAWGSTTKVIDAAVDADSSSDEWKKLAVALEKMVAYFLTQGVRSFETRVQAFLPDGTRFGLRMRDGEREVCQFGFYEKDFLRTALSGSEWLRLTTALAGACRHGDLNIVIPEDRGWDAQTLIEAMDAFGKMDCQVVIATTITAIQEFDGWKIIRTGA